MRVYVLGREAAPDERLVDRLYPDLLRAIAVTELMLEHWIEPARIDELDLSTLTQQILSVLAETGGIRAAELYERLAGRGAFRRVPQHMFARLLRSMAGHDLLEQMPEGDLILAPAGQRIVEGMEFYSAFAAPEEFAILYDGRLIGTLPVLHMPNLHDHLLLAGWRWEVVGADPDWREIVVRPARGLKPPVFTGSAGEIYPRIRKKMRQVLLEDRRYRYINDEAERILGQAREAARSAGLHENPIISLGDNKSLWFTWTGTLAQRTLMALAREAGLDPADHDVGLSLSASRNRIERFCHSLIDSPPDLRDLASQLHEKRLRKFDRYLDDSLVREGLADCAFDMKEAQRVAAQLVGREVAVEE